MLYRIATGLERVDEVVEGHVPLQTATLTLFTLPSSPRKFMWS